MDSVEEGRERVDHEPRIHIIADLSNEQFNLHLSVGMCVFPRFSARRDANLLYMTDAIRMRGNWRCLALWLHVRWWQFLF